MLFRCSFAGVIPAPAVSCCHLFTLSCWRRVTARRGSGIAGLTLWDTPSGCYHTHSCAKGTAAIFSRRLQAPEVPLLFICWFVSVVLWRRGLQGACLKVWLCVAVNEEGGAVTHWLRKRARREALMRCVNTPARCLITAEVRSSLYLRWQVLSGAALFGECGAVRMIAFAPLAALLPSRIHLHKSGIQYAPIFSTFSTMLWSKTLHNVLLKENNQQYRVPRTVFRYFRVLRFLYNSALRLTLSGFPQKKLWLLLVLIEETEVWLVVEACYVWTGYQGNVFWLDTEALGVGSVLQSIYNAVLVSVESHVNMRWDAGVVGNHNKWRDDVPFKT